MSKPANASEATKSATGSGYFVATDASQETEGIYKVSKSANITTTLAQLNAARSARDWKLIKFFPVQDLKKAEEFIQSMLKNKYIPNTKEWIKVDEANLTKILDRMESLVDIVNDSG
jgi:hypothetical protein